MGIKKYYVVWRGRNPGIYDNWPECEAQVKGFEFPQYKSFTSQEEAIEAYRKEAKEYLKPKTEEPQGTQIFGAPNLAAINMHSICVDASCQGNPGRMEYRGVDTATGKEIFRKGIFDDATQNIGEFLAIVHGLTYLKKINSDKAIYTDSKTAMAWVRDKKMKTSLEKTSKNSLVFEWCGKALLWLHSNSYNTPILKWDTDKWGEIPADFGRK